MDTKIASKKARVLDLKLLGSAISKDAQAYVEEYHEQLRHFYSQLAVFQLYDASDQTNTGYTSHYAQSRDKIKKFAQLIEFLCSVVPRYLKDPQSSKYPRDLMGLLQSNYEVLAPVLRKTIAHGLINLQKRNVIDRLELLPLFFKLFRVSDKELRKVIFLHIIHDIKEVNKNHINHKVNNPLQAFMYTMLQDDSEAAAVKSLQVMIELWRRKVWHNSKTVNCVVSACFSKHTKLLLPSLNFFLGNCTFYDEDEMNLDEELMQERLQQAHQHKRAAKFSGKTKKYDREVKRAQTKVKSLAMKGQEEYKSGYDAIQLIYDPHQFAARLFTKVKQAHEKFDTRLFMLNVTSRVISGHKLMLENFYPYMQKYMKPHQNDVIKVLTYTAQACHELVSPDVLQPVVRTLANNFVTDRTRGEVMQIGINAICEITKRCPLAMTAEMLADLIQYRKNKHKGVVVAARALLHTFREINPLLLPKKERGRDEAMAVQRGEREQLEYGEAKTHTNFLGAELYRKYLEDKALRQKYNLGSDDDIPAEATLEDSENDDEVPELVPAGQEGKATSSADAAASGQKRKKPTPSKDDAKQGAKVATPFSHILTPEDYEKIEEYRMKRLANPKKFAKQETLSMQLILERFTGDSDDSDRDERHAYSIDTDMIQGYQKKKKMTKKDRMIHHAAQDRSQFGYNSKKTNGASMTNAQKEKSTKVFAMTKRSRKVRHKSNGSMHEKKNKAKTLKTMIKNQKVLAKKARKRLKK